jgi:hypothetical protein
LVYVDVDGSAKIISVFSITIAAVYWEEKDGSLESSPLLPAPPNNNTRKPASD